MTSEDESIKLSLFQKLFAIFMFVAFIAFLIFNLYKPNIMCIWPASNVFVTGEGQGIWTITRNCISEFVGFNTDDKCTGGASEHCFREAKLAMPLLGKDPNDKGALHELVDVVVAFAPELVLMPATPKHVRKKLEAPAMWEVRATIKESGKVLHEAEV